ncbi:hypothetical protein [Rhabdothermincola salaria]|uniref:hypothetical protein n=1 Tax=Rhabdothermincola salaria TaxID=2903142 RepID=UPI001E3A0C9B|nr:hypothetical protein [Rhabdothermincola salaria]MCD9623575.1 hypothetical protein [Rhabdothermincola salaria]
MTARRSPPRTALGVVLLIVAGMSAALAVATLWLRAEVLDPDAWTDTTAAVLADPVVRADVARTLAEQLVEAVGLEDRVGALLPFPLGGLADSLGDGATDLVAEGAEALVATDAFADLWEQANRTAWTEVLRALRGDGRATAVVDGSLTLELGPSLDLLRRALVDQGVPGIDGLDLGGIDARVVLVPAPELERLEAMIRVLDVAAVALPAIALAAAVVGAVVLRRLGLGLVSVGAGVVLGALAGVVAVRAARIAATEILSGGILGDEAAERTVELVGGSAGGVLLATGVAGAAAVGVGVALLLAAMARRRSVPGSAPVG